MIDSISSSDLDRMQALLEKALDISSDLKTLVAVHEQRLSVQERLYDIMQGSLEKRRDEIIKSFKDVDIKFESYVQSTYADQQINIISKRVTETAAAVTGMQRIIWIGMGIFTFLSVILGAVLPGIAKMLPMIFG